MSALACTVGPNSVSPGQILLVYGIVVQNENIQAAGRRKDCLEVVLKSRFGCNSTICKLYKSAMVRIPVRLLKTCY